MNNPANVPEKNPSKKLNAAALKQLLGVALPKLGEGHVARQVVYRYEPEDREVVEDETHQGCFAGVPAASYKLKAVPASIKSGSHYVVNEVLFRASRHEVFNEARS